MESNIRELIAKLNQDHEIVSAKIYQLNSLINLPAEESFPKIVEMLNFFEDFIFKIHHKREEELLYSWMVKQNKNSDTQLIQKIIDDHNAFSEFAKKIVIDIENHFQNKPAPTVGSIRYDLSLFIGNYVDHIEKEESFIYLIAESLANIAV